MTVALCCGKDTARVARLTNTFTSTDDGSMINVTPTLYTLSSREPDLMCRAAQRDKLCHDNILYKQNIQETYPEVFLETQRQAVSVCLDEETYITVTHYCLKKQSPFFPSHPPPFFPSYPSLKPNWSKQNSLPLLHPTLGDVLRDPRGEMCALSLTLLLALRTAPLSFS